MGLLRIRVELNAQSFFTHGHNELFVCAQARTLGRLQVDADEQVVVAAAKRSGQEGVLDGIEQLRLVHVAAQGMSHSVVAKCAHGTVEHEGVVVELQQVQTLRQLQDVNTPAKEIQIHKPISIRLHWLILPTESYEQIK